MGAAADAEYFAERYEPGTTRNQVEAENVRLAEAASKLRAEGHRIEFLGSTFVPSDEASLTWFRSSSPKLVETAHQRARVDIERVVEALSVPTQACPP